MLTYLSSPPSLPSVCVSGLKGGCVLFNGSTDGEVVFKYFTNTLRAALAFTFLTTVGRRTLIASPPPPRIMTVVEMRYDLL